MRTKHCNIDICFLELFLNRPGLLLCLAGFMFEIWICFSCTHPDLFCFLQAVRSQASVFVGIYSYFVFSS